MTTRRRYTRTEKVVAIAAAEATSVLGAAEAAGIPESTLRYWMDDPEFAPYRENAREAMAEEARVVARMAWAALAKAIREDDLDGRDLVMAAGMATDKSQLLNGGATGRTESRDITGSITDNELIASLREAERLTDPGRAAEAPAGAPEG